MTDLLYITDKQSTGWTGIQFWINVGNDNENLNYEIRYNGRIPDESCVTVFLYISSTYVVQSNSNRQCKPISPEWWGSAVPVTPTRCWLQELICTEVSNKIVNYIFSLRFLGIVLLSLTFVLMVVLILLVPEENVVWGMFARLPDSGSTYQ